MSQAPLGAAVVGTNFGVLTHLRALRNWDICRRGGGDRVQKVPGFLWVKEGSPGVRLRWTTAS